MRLDTGGTARLNAGVPSGMMPNDRRAYSGNNEGTRRISEFDQARLKVFLTRIQHVAPFEDVRVRVTSYGTSGFLVVALRNEVPLLISSHLQHSRRMQAVDEEVVWADITSLSFWPPQLKAAPRDSLEPGERPYSRRNPR